MHNTQTQKFTYKQTKQKEKHNLTSKDSSKNKDHTKTFRQRNIQ